MIMLTSTIDGDDDWNGDVAEEGETGGGSLSLI